MKEEVRAQVETYVYANYKNYVGKELIIREEESMFMIFKHKDGSPLILSKKILN